MRLPHYNCTCSMYEKNRDFIANCYVFIARRVGGFESSMCYVVPRGYVDGDDQEQSLHFSREYMRCRYFLFYHRKRPHRYHVDNKKLATNIIPAVRQYKTFQQKKCLRLILLFVCFKQPTCPEETGILFQAEFRVFHVKKQLE